VSLAYERVAADKRYGLLYTELSNLARIAR